MSSTQRFRYAGWSVYLSGAAMVLSLLALILFSSFGQPWGTLYDTSVLFQLLFMLPFVFALQARLGSESSGLKRFSERMAIFLVLFVTIVQALVVFGAFGPQGFSQTLDKGLSVSSAIGIWLLLSNYLGQGSWTLNRNLTWFGNLAAAGFILTPIVFKNVEPGSRLIIIGLLASAIGYAVWAILLGRLLLSGQLGR